MSIAPQKTQSPEIGETSGELSAPIRTGLRCTPCGDVPPVGTPLESRRTVDAAPTESSEAMATLLARKSDLERSLAGAHAERHAAEQTIRSIERALALIAEQIAQAQEATS